MSPILPVSRGYSREHRVLQIVAPETIQSRRKAGNARGDNDATRTAHPAGLGQSLKSVGPLGEMVKRSEQQDCVHARIRERKLPRVTHLCAGEHRRGSALGGAAGLLDVQCYRVDQVNLVSLPGEPYGVSAWPAADVGQHRWSRWEISLE